MGGVKRSFETEVTTFWASGRSTVLVVLSSLQRRPSSAIDPSGIWDWWVLWLWTDGWVTDTGLGCLAAQVEVDRIGFGAIRRSVGGMMKCAR